MSGKKRPAAASSSAGSAHGPYSMPMVYYSPYQGFPPTGGPPLYNPAGFSTPTSGSGSKPWEVSSSSEDEDDFASKKKRKPKKPVPNSGSDIKRGPGRPRKVESQLPSKTDSNITAILSRYPPAFTGSDSIAFGESIECPSCRMYKGRVAVFPCGHHKFCFTCINKMRKEALTMQRPGKCLNELCYALVEGWVELFNVSG